MILGILYYSLKKVCETVAGQPEVCAVCGLLLQRVQMEVQ